MEGSLDQMEPNKNSLSHYLLETQKPPRSPSQHWVGVLKNWAVWPYLSANRQKQPKSLCLASLQHYLDVLSSDVYLPAGHNLLSQQLVTYNIFYHPLYDAAHRASAEARIVAALH